MARFAAVHTLILSLVPLKVRKSNTSSHSFLPNGVISDKSSSVLAVTLSSSNKWAKLRLLPWFKLPYGSYGTTQPKHLVPLVPTYRFASGLSRRRSLCSALSWRSSREMNSSVALPGNSMELLWCYACRLLLADCEQPCTKTLQGRAASSKSFNRSSNFKRLPSCIFLDEASGIHANTSSVFMKVFRKHVFSTHDNLKIIQIMQNMFFHVLC